jgi:hypothetical protein
VRAIESTVRAVLCHAQIAIVHEQSRIESRTSLPADHTPRDTLQIVVNESDDLIPSQCITASSLRK